MTLITERGPEGTADVPVSSLLLTSCAFGISWMVSPPTNLAWWASAWLSLPPPLSSPPHQLPTGPECSPSPPFPIPSLSLQPHCLVLAVLLGPWWEYPNLPFHRLMSSLCYHVVLKTLLWMPSKTGKLLSTVSSDLQDMILDCSSGLLLWPLSTTCLMVLSLLQAPSWL